MCFYFNLSPAKSFVCDQEGMEHPWCDLIYLTDIMAEFECDVFFPEFDRQLFKVQDRCVQYGHLRVFKSLFSKEEH